MRNEQYSKATLEAQTLIGKQIAFLIEIEESSDPIKLVREKVYDDDMILLGQDLLAVLESCRYNDHDSIKNELMVEVKYLRKFKLGQLELWM